MNGEGVVYANEKILLQSNSWLCGTADCDLSWDPNMEPPHLLFLIVGYAGHPAIADHVEAENGRTSTRGRGSPRCRTAHRRRERRS